ncbi:uncharacterized protein LOC118180421, partial [Stegodyphus dumicola]|uniref:uncharacterized protein LOC118180421 n=1 Tax=Stegodyphus dumicola TaxID=202533 RepID=UPI0015A9907C
LIVVIYSIYSPPTDDITPVIAFLEENLRIIGNKHQIISGDFNAHSIAWGYTTTDPKGRLLEDFISSKNYVLFNSPDSAPTFDRTYAIGWPDLTFTKANTAHLVHNWTIHDEISLSDHKFITFEITNNGSVPILIRYNLPGRKYRQFTRKIRGKLNQLRRQLSLQTTPAALEQFTDGLGFNYNPRYLSRSSSKENK